MSAVLNVKTRGILFGGPMVRALLARTKTQTRRIIKPQPTCTTDQAKAAHPSGSFSLEVGFDDRHRCPYGVPGDRLWVRETWTSAYARGCWGTIFAADQTFAQGKRNHEKGPHYNFDDRPPGMLWRPSIFLPRWASRITLEVTEVRVQRLQSLNEEDAVAEGWDGDGCPIPWYSELWTQINGPGSWEANPFVWALSFRRLTP